MISRRSAFIYSQLRRARCAWSSHSFLGRSVMRARFLRCVFTVSVLSVCLLSISPGNLKAATAAEPSKFVGTWKGSIAGYDETWVVKNNDGAWSINGKFQFNGADAGSFIGVDIKETMGTLT